MLKISTFCVIVAAIFFILGICAEVVLLNYDAGIISIIVPLNIILNVIMEFYR